MISWKTITYGRVDRIVEILHSFLIQEDSSDRELVIVNDYPLQKLIFDHPKVKIINLNKTFETIGEKENFAISECRGDIIVTADDDDIALPWHMKNIIQYTEGIDFNILHWQRGVYYNEPKITAITSVGNSGIVYTKKALSAIGGYPIENAGADSTLSQKLHKLGANKVVRANPADEKVSWFYRWGTSNNKAKGEVGVYHQSGQGRDVPGKPNIIERHSRYIEQQRQMGNIPTGNIHLQPYWKYDYASMLAAYLKTQK